MELGHELRRLRFGFLRLRRHVKVDALGFESLQNGFGLGDGRQALATAGSANVNGSPPARLSPYLFFHQATDLLSEIHKFPDILLDQHIKVLNLRRHGLSCGKRWMRWMRRKGLRRFRAGSRRRRDSNTETTRRRTPVNRHGHILQPGRCGLESELCGCLVSTGGTRRHSHASSVAERNTGIISLVCDNFAILTA